MPVRKGNPGSDFGHKILPRFVPDPANVFAHVDHLSQFLAGGVYLSADVIEVVEGEGRGGLGVYGFPSSFDSITTMAVRRVGISTPDWGPAAPTQAGRLRRMPTPKE